MTSTTPSSSSAAVRGINNGTGGSGIGVYGSQNGSGYGVYGSASSGYGVVGSGTYGIYGSGSTGVYGTSSSGRGAWGVSTDSFGVEGDSTSNVGVAGYSSSYGVYGHSSDGFGVSGISDNSVGISGSSSTSNGIQAVSGSGPGLFAQSTSSSGVDGRSSTGNGVQGISTSGTGVLGQSTNGYAGYFIGNLGISGTLSKGAGSFKIDHPLDPAHKYLSHSFVESPDMMNIYNGNAILNSKGEATVQMPNYFSALNKEFRYQLTAIGAPGPNLYIARKIENNTFKIAGGKAGMEVSWQVTGVRHDAYANAHRISVEQIKKGKEYGAYLHPELFGQPKEKSVEWVLYPQIGQPSAARLVKQPELRKP